VAFAGSDGKALPTQTVEFDGASLKAVTP
jgi:hypothetical protein